MAAPMDRNERRRSSVAEASPVSYVKAPQSAKQRSQPARSRRSPCPIRQKDGRGRASEKHRQQKKSFQPGPLPTVELEQSISMSTDDKDKKRTSSQFGPLPTADAAKQLTHGEKKEHSSRDDHRSKDNQDQHHSSRAPTRSRSSTQSAEARDHRERSPGRLQHEKPRSSSSSNSPPKCSEVFVREKSGSASTGEPLQAFEPTPALLQLGQLRLQIDPPAHPVEAARDVLSPRADHALVPPASPDVPRESIYSTALVSGHSTMADDTNHHAPPEPSDDSTTVDSTRNNDHRRQQDVRVGTHYLRRATSTADADSSRPSASRFGPLPIADSTEAEVQAPHPPAHLIRRSASRFGPLPIVDSAEAENTNAPQDPVTLSMFACLDAVPVPVTRGAPDILMDQHPPSALDKEGASTMGDLQLNRNIDDDGPDRNTYSQSARNRSTSKERQSWSGAPQFGPLPTADAAATVTASSSQDAALVNPADSRCGPWPIAAKAGSKADAMPKDPAMEATDKSDTGRLPNRRHGPGTDAGEATTATVSTGSSTEQLNKPRGLKTITEAANKVAARRHRLQHVIKPLKPTDLETATAKKIQAPMQKERAGAAANTPQQPVDQSDPSASRFGPLPVVDSTGGAAKMPQQPANQSKPNASRFGPLPIVDSTGAEPIYTPQHPTTQTKSARSDSGHLPDKDHTVGHASKDLPDAVHSSSSLSTETERRVLVDELARTIKALYGGTILHAVSAELMRHFPDAAGPGNNPILDSILEYVARKTTAQLADSYPTLLRDMPRLLTIPRRKLTLLNQLLTPCSSPSPGLIRWIRKTTLPA
ncbi:hypothetical protein AAVH_17580 [Aphelenchoides avenae]|nr:hypothetical protein AAVH_17580 [Aphelenchus avenae]